MIGTNIENQLFLNDGKGTVLTNKITVPYPTTSTNTMNVFDYIVDDINGDGLNDFININDLNIDVELLLIKTGYENYRIQDKYWNDNPGLSSELASYFRTRFKKLRCIGFDFISLTSWNHRLEGRLSHREFLTPDQPNSSILIIEDAERVISDREGNGSPAGVSNILNLTDGILADCLNIQIIATFNMKRERIDQALLRKGRLIAEHKFEKLSAEDTNKLLKHLGKSQEVSESMSLADIYNIDVELFKSTNKNTSKIGF